MTTIHDEMRGALNVTLIACTENIVAAHRLPERDGYSAVKLSTRKTRRRKTEKEFRLDTGVQASTAPAVLESLAVGSVLSVTQFVPGDKVNISGITKAKGFQGVVKRHGFKGQMTSHGRKHDMRKPGSIGSTFPEHVIKGRRMAGRMGAERFTVRNLEVVYVDATQGLLGVRGAVPGVAGRMVEVRCI